MPLRFFYNLPEWALLKGVFKMPQKKQMDAIKRKLERGLKWVGEAHDELLDLRFSSGGLPRDMAIAGYTADISNMSTSMAQASGFVTMDEALNWLSTAIRGGVLDKAEAARQLGLIVPDAGKEKADDSDSSAE